MGVETGFALGAPANLPALPRSLFCSQLSYSALRADLSTLFCPLHVSASCCSRALPEFQLTAGFRSSFRVPKEGKGAIALPRALPTAPRSLTPARPLCPSWLPGLAQAVVPPLPSTTPRGPCGLAPSLSLYLLLLSTPAHIARR